MRQVRVLISGRVQGVGYRFWTEDQAARLGLDGWVRNRRDGRVEAVFAGPAEAVESMLQACLEGPRLAAVTKVEKADETDPISPGFHTRPTV